MPSKKVPVAGLSLTKMEPGEPNRPTDIVGRPVGTAYMVTTGGRDIGRVWREREGTPWGWSLYAEPEEDDSDVFMVVIGGDAGTRSEATERLRDAHQQYLAGTLEGIRPPVTVELHLDG